MRLTKRVQEYITNEVEKKYESYSEKERKAYKQYEDAIRDFMKRKTEELNAELQSEFSYIFDNWQNDGWCNSKPAFEYRLPTLRIPEYDAYDKKNSEKRKLIREKTENIMLRMELGGTLDDLNAMITEL